MTTATLLPCPFCGIYSIDSEECYGLAIAHTAVWWVRCTGCGCEGPADSKTKKAAITAWNRRAPIVPAWIKCSERMPERFANVLIWYLDEKGLRVMDVAQWTRLDWATPWGLSSKESVTHWMPLPPPPTPEAK